MDMFGFTLSRLDKLARRGQVGRGLLKGVAAATGVPHRTIQKLTSRAVSNPTIKTLQPLYDFVIEFDEEINELDKSLTKIQQRRMKDDAARHKLPTGSKN